VPGVSEAPDQALIDRYLAGDADAFAVLVRRYEGRVYGLCLRVLGDADDAADAAQDALITVARKLGSFRGEARFSTWLHRVTMNVCYDHLRDAKRRPVVRRLLDDGPNTDLGDPVADHADEVAGTRDVAAALAKVPEDFRVALVLADVQDLAYEEIARILDVPVGTVKSRVHRGRLALARALGIEAPEPADAPATSEEER
jgi:RNA polymerase sigma-70 factor (ECF subfamily)